MYKQKGEKLLAAGLKDDRMYFVLRGKLQAAVPLKEVIVHNLQTKRKAAQNQ
jgi:hypothetical protein